MRYRLTRDDGVEIDVSGVLWESVLERAYQNGWRPCGTTAPWAERPTARSSGLVDPPPRNGGRWRESDYFSASSQYVRASDARELGNAARHERPERADGVPHADGRQDADVRKVAAFAQRGGFVIGRAPETPRAR